LSSYEVWWNDSVTAWGQAKDSGGDPISGAWVNLTVGSTEYNNCNQTNSSGDWECVFNAPLELGTYTVSATVSYVTNSTSLEVKITYGQEPIGTIDRVVFEIPALIQEPSGRIRIVWFRILVWRG
jgi:hypothetical protein